MEYLVLERTLKISPFQRPAMGKDTFPQVRLLRAPSNLALNSARDGAPTTSP